MRSLRLVVAIGLIGVLGVGFRQVLLLLDTAPTIPARLAISCGQEGQVFVRPAPPKNVAARECFWAAYLERRPAEFRSTMWTIEGDPVMSTYTIRADGAIEVIVDWSQDKFSNRKIVTLDCRDLERFDDPLLPDPLQFGPGDACVERGQPPA